jgi:hypothetical protein
MPEPDDDPEEGLRGTVLTALATSALTAFALLALVGAVVLVFSQRDTGIRGRAAAPPSESASVQPTPDNGSASSASGQATPRGVKVVVLNATGRTGAAARFQKQLEARGWPVAAIGNFNGTVPASTVYYPRGQQAAAETLDAQFPQVSRVRPAFTGISTTRLTVILSNNTGQ